MTAPNLLLLDEITNDLDIPTLVALEEYLESFPGCLVVVSHDRYFLDRTIEYLFRFEGDGRIREYPGNYSAFMEIRDREKAELEDAKIAARRPAPREPEPEGRTSAGAKRKLTFKEKRELEELEQSIARLEARKLELDRELETFASDHVRVQSLYEESQSLAKTLDHDLNRWTELAELA
jgi:ATP-binding cassette subfamily F protein uup